MKLTDIQNDYRYLILGASGTGKTTLCGTLAEIMPTVIVTADLAGLATLKKMKILPTTEIIFIESWENIWDYYKDVARLSENYLGIAIDDFSAIQETSRHRLERKPRTTQEERMGKTEVKLAIRQELMLGDRRLRLTDWGGLWVAMENFLYEVLKLPYKIKLVTVLEEKAINPRTSEEAIYPALQGSLRTTILARFGFVGETFVTYSTERKPLYCLHCCSHPRVESKTRFGEGRTWVNPTIQKLINHIKGGDNAETELERRIGIGV